MHIEDGLVRLSWVHRKDTVSYTILGREKQMIRKTLTAAFAVAVIGTSAMIATPSASQAGGYYGGGYYQPVFNYGYHCYWKKIKVWGPYGYFWKKVRVCH